MGEKYIAISCYSINFHNGTTTHTTMEMKEVCPFSHSYPHCPFMAVDQHINELNIDVFSGSKSVCYIIHLSRLLIGYNIYSV